MEVKHTPLPWKAENGESRGAWIMGADEGWAALVCGDNDSTAIANKDFIVRACNSHYALLESAKSTTAALVAAVSLLKRGSKKAAPSDKMFDTMIADYENAIEAARAAISQAEGRS